MAAKEVWRSIGPPPVAADSVSVQNESESFISDLSSEWWNSCQAVTWQMEMWVSTETVESKRERRLVLPP